MFKILAEKFIEKLNDPGNIVYMKDLEVDGKVEVYGEFVNCEGLYFKGCTFNDTLKISECKLEKDIVFEDCKFLNGIVFKKIEVGYHEKSRFEIINSISIIECEIEHNFHIVLCNLKRRLHIIKSVIQRLFLQQITSINDGIKIKSSTIHEWFDCNNLRLYGSLDISNCTINTKTRLHDTRASNISFVKNLFTKDLWVTGGLIENGVTFNDGVFEDNIILDAVKAKKILTIIGGKFKESVSVKYENTTHDLEGSFQDIYIQSANFESGLSIFDSDLLNPSRLNSIFIPFNAQLNGKISIENLKVNSMKFSGTNFNSKLALNKIQPKQIIFDSFSNYSDIQLTDFKADQSYDSEFIINKSYLGKFQLIDANLTSFNKIIIINSHYSDIITSSVVWFEDSQLEVLPVNFNKTFIQQLKFIFSTLFKNLLLDDNNVINATRKQEIYRQLKVAMEKHGNRIQSLKFKQLEMKYYGKLLQYTKNLWDLDRLILISNLTNNHGKHWFKPVLLAIFLTIPFYILMIASMSPDLALAPANSVQDIKSTYNILSDNLAIYIQLFNPARLLNRIIPENFNTQPMTHFLDILQRIVLSFLIFQTISAFRKFSKS